MHEHLVDLLESPPHARESSADPCVKVIIPEDSTLYVEPGKTGHDRTVRVVRPLAVDLREWRLASERREGDSFVFPGIDGAEWTENAFNKWRDRIFLPTLDALGVGHARPYDLRHSYASLALHEGRSVIDVARQLGHGADLTVKTYAHVMAELEDRPHLSVETAIKEAREAVSEDCRTRLVPASAVGGRGERRTPRYS